MSDLGGLPIKLLMLFEVGGCDILLDSKELFLLISINGIGFSLGN
jgi:hypothetical protein